MSESPAYTLLRHLQTNGANIKPIFNDYEPIEIMSVDIVDMMFARRNINYIAKLIIDKADPLRNGSSIRSPDMVAMIKAKVSEYLNSWRMLGKFDKHMTSNDNKRVLAKTVNFVSMVDSYNKEFVDAFANRILPHDDPTQVTSVVNPNGLYAQQERLLVTNSKPTPFYERALYRRLNDWNLDIRQDETEMPFYKMDHNPRLSDAERKKTNSTVEESTYLDRQNLSFRMKPNY